MVTLTFETWEEWEAAISQVASLEIAIANIPKME